MNSTLLAGKTAAILAAGTAPPGVGTQFATVQGWALWVVTALAGVVAIIIGGTMMVQHKQGHQNTAASSLGYYLAGCLVVAFGAAGGATGLL